MRSQWYPAQCRGHKRGQKGKEEAQSPGGSRELIMDLARWDLLMTLITVTSGQWGRKTCPKRVTKRIGHKGVQEY